MKLKSLNKEIMAMLLSATFLFTSLPAVSSFADEVSTNDNKVVQADKEKKEGEVKDEGNKEVEKVSDNIDVSVDVDYDTKTQMPESKSLTVNLKNVPYSSGKGYLMLDVEEKVCKDRSKKDPLYATVGSTKTYLLNDYARYDVPHDSDKATYRFYIPCDFAELSKESKIVIVDPNNESAFTGKFNMRVYASLLGKNTIEPAKTVGDLSQNKIHATGDYEDEKIYEGFVFGNIGGEKIEKLFIRPDARSSRIRLNLGARDEDGFSYDNKNKNNDFSVKYYNTQETYDKIKAHGANDKNGDSKYNDDEYVEEDVSVDSSNSISLPWFPDHGIIEITLKNPNNFLLRLSVEQENDSINLPDGNTDKPDTDKPDTDKPIDSKVTRYSDGNRYSTAIKLSKKVYNKSDIAVVASGENFADALSGGALAAIHEAPLLLVNEGSTADDVKAELDRLKVDKLYILGGTKSISNKIEFKLSKNKDDKNREVIRLSGSDRYKTSMEVYKEVTRASGSNESPVLVNGKQFADALSAGPIAAKDKRAIVLTDGHNVDSRIDKKSDKNIIVGGYTSMDNSFAGYRYSGRDRYETSAKIAKHFNSPKNALLASGEKYPDGLAAITLYNKYEGPLLLTRKDSLAKDIKSYISSSDIENVYIIGGTSSVSEKVENTFKK